MDNDKKQVNGLGVASLICGLIGLVIFGLPFGNCSNRFRSALFR
jgi:hypothetical protein